MKYAIHRERQRTGASASPSKETGGKAKASEKATAKSAEPQGAKEDDSLIASLRAGAAAVGEKAAAATSATNEGKAKAADEQVASKAVAKEEEESEEESEEDSDEESGEESEEESEEDRDEESEEEEEEQPKGKAKSKAADKGNAKK